MSSSDHAPESALNLCEPRPTGAYGEWTRRLDIRAPWSTLLTPHELCDARSSTSSSSTCARSTSSQALRTSFARSLSHPPSLAPSPTPLPVLTPPCSVVTRYEASSWGWSRRRKEHELIAGDMQYLALHAAAPDARLAAVACFAETHEASADGTRQRPVLYWSVAIRLPFQESFVPVLSHTPCPWFFKLPFATATSCKSRRGRSVAGSARGSWTCSRASPFSATWTPSFSPSFMVRRLPPALPRTHRVLIAACLAAFHLSQHERYGLLPRPRLRPRRDEPRAVCYRHCGHCCWPEPDGLCELCDSGAGGNADSATLTIIS